METRYIKLNYLNSLQSKKSMLGSEINLLQILRKLKSYKVLRLKELDYKNKLRIELGKFGKSIDFLEKSFPSYEFSKDKRKNKQKTFFDSDRDLESELNEIKRKIANLSK